MASSVAELRSERDKPVDDQTQEQIYTHCSSEIVRIISEYSDIDKYLEEYAEFVLHGINEIRKIKNEYDSAYQRYSDKLAELGDGRKRCSLLGEHYCIPDSLFTLRSMLRNEL